MADSDDSVLGSPSLATPRTLHDIFPPVKKSHILNCSYPKWHRTYRTLTPRTRIIPLSPEFMAYLRQDGIVLPSDEDVITTLSDSDDSDDDDDEVGLFKCFHLIHTPSAFFISPRQAEKTNRIVRKYSAPG